MVVGESHYSVGKRYCRRCECYFVTDKKFCPCCGMQLRITPSEGQYKEKMRGNMITVKKNAEGRNNSSSGGSSF
jgi:rRNA maturation endonuclease Nob1